MEPGCTNLRPEAGSTQGSVGRRGGLYITETETASRTAAQWLGKLLATDACAGNIRGRTCKCKTPEGGVALPISARRGLYCSGISLITHHPLFATSSVPVPGTKKRPSQRS
jgi:hypothetical protein